VTKPSVSNAPQTGHSDAIWTLRCWRHGVDHVYVRFWPKADIETESKSVFLNVRFGGESGRSEGPIHLLAREFSAVGVCSGLGDKAKPA